jgi:hypothetical protein
MSNPAFTFDHVHIISADPKASAATHPAWLDLPGAGIALPVRAVLSGSGRGWAELWHLI